MPRAISLIDLPLTRCSRRIRPIVCTISIPHRPPLPKRTAQNSGCRSPSSEAQSAPIHRLTAPAIGYRSGRSWLPDLKLHHLAATRGLSTRRLLTNRSRVLNAGQSMDAACDISLSISLVRPRHSQTPTSGTTVVARTDRRVDRSPSHAGRRDWNVSLG
jgi:hypothetical protein